MKTLWVSVRALAFATGFVLFWGWISLSLRPLDSRWSVRLPHLGQPVGVALMVLGGLSAGWSILSFIILGRGTPAPVDPPRNFVAQGPYRLCRNPMYVGAFLLLAGLGLRQESPAMFLFSILWIAVVHVLVIGREEPGLRKRFGESYAEYCRTVPRWLPLGRQSPKDSLDSTRA